MASFALMNPGNVVWPLDMRHGRSRVPSLRSGPGMTRFLFRVFTALGSKLSIPPHAGLLRVAEQRQQLPQTLLRRLAGRVDDEIRLGVERLAAGENRDEIVHGAIVVGHRAQIALL